jgi:hypothetical protein
VESDNPVAYLRLDESMGTVAIDRSGHGNNGLYQLDTCATISYGIAGALVGDPDPAIAVSADGNLGNGCVAEVTLPAAFDPFTGDFTVEQWVEPAQVPPGGMMFSIFLFEDYLIAGFRIGWSWEMFPAMWTSQGGGTSSVVGTTALAMDAWSHVVVTKAGTQVTIYLQGAMVAQAAVVYVTPSTAADNCLGGCHGMPSFGAFDELAIYDYALSPERVAAHYAAAQ